jgi:hypothetical protein
MSVLTKPKLLPASVPWMISPSAPYLNATPAGNSSPASVTFIAYFRNEDRGGGRTLQYVPKPPEFQPATDGDRVPYRLVRLVFEDATHMQVHPAFSDLEVIPEKDFDWSEIPGARMPGEPVEDTVARRREWWIKTGTAPDARIYEIDEADASARASAHRRYLICGHDTYVEVVARAWRWEPGQPVA